MSVRSDLERVGLFAGLAPAALDRLAAVALERRYDDGQIILLEGDPDSPACFLLDGRVRVFRTHPDGREQTLVILTPGAAFNTATAFDAREGGPASAAAVGAVRLLSITAADFVRVVSETPPVALALLGDFAVKLHHLTDLTADLGLRSVRGRLARFLLTQADVGQGAPVQLTQADIAAQLGTVRDVVGRTLRAFADAGLVRIERQRVVLLDREGLEAETQC